MPPTIAKNPANLMAVDTPKGGKSVPDVSEVCFDEY